MNQNIFMERRSVKNYEKDTRIPKDVLDELFRLTSFSPSAWNLQHWRFVVIETQEQKQAIFSAAYNQQQVLDCSAVIVVLGDLEAHRNARDILGQSVARGVMPERAAEAWASAAHRRYESDPQFARDEAIRNASLAAMQLMLAGKCLGLDSGPIGSFYPEELKSALRIPNRYLPILLITLGYADGSPYPTDRLPIEQTMIFESF